jgi:hypothetical protein
VFYVLYRAVLATYVIAPAILAGGTNRELRGNMPAIERWANEPYGRRDLKEVSMQRKSISRISIIAARVMVVCGLLFTVSGARADDDDKCTDRTLRGDYGFAAEGVLLGTPGLPAQAQFRSLGVAHFNGRGSLTWVEHTVVNGVPVNADFVLATGTYSVNANCTGTAVVTTPNSPVPLRLSLVIVKEGREIRTVLDASSVGAVYSKIE